MRLQTSLLLTTAALMVAATPALAASTSRVSGADQGPRGPIYAGAVAPMNRTIETRLLPQMAVLLDKLLAEKRDMTLDGVKVFEADDKFLPGKIAIGLAYLVVDTPRTDPKFAKYLAAYRQIADLTVDDPNDTWGIYYYCQALWMLKEAGLLDQAVSPETQAKLKAKLDWRRFVRTDDLTLINLPNNYYGVAFSVARLRYRLGWEDASASEALLGRTLEHYRKYSGEYGFADETDGEGRFDRYSVLLIGEISHRLIEAGMPATPEVRAWLRRSVDLMLPRLNLRGEGFEYGRSIGTYGETAFLEVLTAAAKLDVLTPKEKTMAYAFSSRVAARYMDFWFDPKMGSVNMWEHGRRTDNYRGKHRILGENLSLGRQYIYTSAIWDELGFKDKAPDPGYAAWLNTLPKRSVTWFARGKNDRLVITLRDSTGGKGGRVIGLPIINGGETQHMHTPYYPIPFSPGMLQGVADAEFPQLLPRITLADGAQLAPLAYAAHVKIDERGARTIVTYDQDQLDRLGQRAPVADDRFSVKTTYVLEPGRIHRTDVFTPKGAVPVKAVDLAFASFSGKAVTKGGATTFGTGDVTGFTVEGLSCSTRPLADDKAYRAPTGAMTALTSCTGGAVEGRPITVSWTIAYK
ncbi:MULTISPECIES: hypothetical protein [unclassified Caulobacter]|uniref:hypothetical protein n=1 Tax=unclassified Caulobacter TaxID=2648921 RepID=UPI0006FE3DC4|nr:MULTISPECIES: hypothetical protein [unclassified Caulobacter]KQV58736.1 hypothetical protein ASC62_08175 [Caulobacter sp. Root342]KQV68755.1 hypothetical protein ASC70_07860 [Caulobacter sp. Root343]